MTLRLEPCGASLDATRLEAGDLVGSRYRLERTIDDGAGGTVWLATEEALQRRVVVKLPADRAPGGLEARFERGEMSVEGRPRTALSSRSLCTDTVGQETQEFEVLSLPPGV